MSQLGQDLGAQAPTTASLELLAIALRARPTTVDELAAMVRDSAQLPTRLAELAQHGLIVLDADRIGYPPTAHALSTLTARVLDGARQEISARMSIADGLLDALPQLIANAAIGGAERADLGGELFHGPTAAHELWHSLILQQSEQRSACMFPDAEPLLVADSALSDAWRAALGERPMRVRAIVSIADVARPESRAMIEAATESGVEFRAMRQPPSWFWLTEEAAGLPLRWGDPWPTSALALRSDAVVSLMHGLFDAWWSKAATLEPTSRPWDAIVALMADGATLEAAAHAVGVSTRTGRRRIEAAMDHYGVSGAVALGAAWQHERALTSG